MVQVDGCETKLAFPIKTDLVKKCDGQSAGYFSVVLPITPGCNTPISQGTTGSRTTVRSHWDFG